MTSAAPARKPYRKAPPQHRETRHSVPAFREDLGGSGPTPSHPEPCQESLSDGDRIKILQQQNEDLRRRLSQTTHKMETMETEFEASRHYMQAEIGRTRDDLEKMRDKFRRLQNSYTASQRANQDLEEKLHALLRKVERDKKTMDQEIVELTNKLVDAKNTIDKLEELNERYRQDCNLAVQLLKCNKSHFRNHKFADLPYELQDMVNKHMKNSLPERAQGSQGAQAQEPDTLSLTPADVVPTSVIARVLEKPEPLVLNSAQSSSSAGRPVAEDVFVHVDMTGPQDESAGRENGGPGHARLPAGPGSEQQHLNGMCRRQGSLDCQSGEEGAAPSFEKLSPYPTPPPPHPLYPGRKVIEFSSDDKVKIPKNSPLPNCTYATRQAISLSLVQNEDEAADRQRTVPNSPAVSDGGWRSGTSSSSGGGGGGGGVGGNVPNHRPSFPQMDVTEPQSSQSSPFSSPPQPPSAFASSDSSEEDLLANWQRMFVEKMAPSSEGTLVNRTSFSSETIKDLQRTRSVKSGSEAIDRGAIRGAYSDGEEGSSARSWTASRESSLDTDTSSMADLRTKKGQYGGNFSPEESERLLMSLDPLDNSDGASGDTAVAVETSPTSAKQQQQPEEEFAEDAGSAGSSAEERDILPQDFPVIAPRVLAGLEDYAEKPPLHHHPKTGLSAGPTGSTRPQKSPKRMGVHHLHRKDSLTRAQEHGNLLD
ncbi:tight junction-associated protein 1 [Chanos chanos]|uniref:Tight junction-associated protein 1 n=1 Tax=Chanos chanos TaxID=29144 RepID=A0A6J2V5I1_CHACN|nr:tight junction-associated protein 1 [Chanos chanos]